MKAELQPLTPLEPVFVFTQLAEARRVGAQAQLAAAAELEDTTRKLRTSHAAEVDALEASLVTARSEAAATIETLQHQLSDVRLQPRGANVFLPAIRYVPMIVLNQVDTYSKVNGSSPILVVKEIEQK